jgi:hypothetical protein
MSGVQAIHAARARLDAARDALRARPREQTLDVLAALLDEWSRPDSPWQRQLVDEHAAAAGFSPANVREGLQRGLAPWTGKALRDLVAGELGALGPAQLVTGFDRTSVVLAGSIPMPTFLSLLAPLVLHSPVLARPASRDPVTPRLFVDSLAARDPELARCVEIVAFPKNDPACTRAFLDAGLVVATGSDETVAAVAGHLHPGTRLVANGHRLSLSVIGPEATGSDDTVQAVAAATALDVALWDQLGCLSPVAVLCQAEPAQCERLAEALAEALAKLEAELPRGTPDPEAAAAIRREREEAMMRRAAGGDVGIHGDPRGRFTVVREADDDWRPAPLHRFVRVHPLRSRKALCERVASLGRHLAGVALAGFGDEQDAVAAAMASRGASRICPPGRLQAPPLSWHHEGRSPLLPLARISDLEAC